MGAIFITPWIQNNLGRRAIDLLLGSTQALLRRGGKKSRGRDQRGSRVKLKTEPRLVQNRDIEISIGGDGLVQEQVAEDGLDRLAIGRVGQVFLEWTVALGNDEVIGVRAGGVRHDGDIIGGGESGDLEELGHTTEPHNIGLDDVEVTALDELAEAVAGELMLTGGELDGGVGALQQGVAVEVIGRKALLPPVNVQANGLAALDQLDSVGDSKRHVAVDTKGEIGSDAGSLQTQVLDVLQETLGALVRAVGQSDLGSDEAHGPGGRRLRTSAVEIQSLPSGTADHLVDGLVANLTQEIPDGQVNDRDHGYGQTLAAIEH